MNTTYVKRHVELAPLLTSPRRKSTDRGRNQLGFPPLCMPFARGRVRVGAKLRP